MRRAIENEDEVRRSWMLRVTDHAEHVVCLGGTCSHSMFQKIKGRRCVKQAAVEPQRWNCSP